MKVVKAAYVCRGGGGGAKLVNVSQRRSLHVSSLSGAGNTAQELLVLYKPNAHVNAGSATHSPSRRRRRLYGFLRAAPRRAGTHHSLAICCIGVVRAPNER